MIVAITGNIGSGKSSVARYLIEHIDALHCDTDLVCRNLLEKFQPGWIEVQKEWGKRFLDQEGHIDKKNLRKAVFEDDKIRHKLEKILHPYVHEHVAKLIKQCSSAQTLMVVEVPLLFEVGWQHDFDYIVTVSAERQDAVERVVARDNVSAEQVEKILNTQVSISDKAQCSDFVIDNSGSIESTYAQVDILKARILSKQGGC